MKLFGKDMTKEELCKRVGDLSQIADAREGVLTAGKADGVRVIDVRTGGGFSFSILPSRGMDIAWAEYKGCLLYTSATALYVQPKGQYKLVREAVESPQKYRFTEEQMEVRESIPEENRESLAEFPYGSIVCGWETRKAFYLFISETEAFLIPKDQLADSSGFSAFLARKLEERYFRQKN